jgi:hypothetical protein
MIVKKFLVSLSLCFCFSVLSLLNLWPHLKKVLSSKAALLAVPQQHQKRALFRS